MKSILEELYYNNISDSGEYVRKDPRYAKAISLCGKNVDNLLSRLNEEEREIFERFTDAQTEVELIEHERIFTYGFKLAALILAEVFLTGDELTHAPPT